MRACSGIWLFLIFGCLMKSGEKKTWLSSDTQCSSGHTGSFQNSEADVVSFTPVPTAVHSLHCQLLVFLLAHSVAMYGFITRETLGGILHSTFDLKALLMILN